MGLDPDFHFATRVSDMQDGAHFSQTLQQRHLKAHSKRECAVHSKIIFCATYLDLKIPINMGIRHSTP